MDHVNDEGVRLWQACKIKILPRLPCLKRSFLATAASRSSFLLYLPGIRDAMASRDH